MASTSKVHHGIACLSGHSSCVASSQGHTVTLSQVCSATILNICVHCSQNSRSHTHSGQMQSCVRKPGNQQWPLSLPAAVLHDQDELVRRLAGSQQLQDVGVVRQVRHHVHLPCALHNIVCQRRSNAVMTIILLLQHLLQYYHSMF